MQTFDQAITEIMPTFCAIPFVGLMVNPDATVKPCCMMKKGTNVLHNEDGSIATVRDDFKLLWNSSRLKQIRIDMISGNKVSGCEVCYLQEDSGRKSNRQQSNDEWAGKLGKDHLYKLMDKAILKNGELDYSIAYLDLRLGNLCNLKCRMCSPWNSSQIAKEHLDLETRDKEYKLVWEKSFGHFNKQFLDVQQFFEDDILWDQIIELIPKLHKVYMTGGEPTLIENNFKFMEECIKQGRKDIVLFFNTNCTNVNKKFTALIQQFDNVYINASIDGIGEMNDYIRAPSKWLQISANIEKLAQMSNVHLGITPTVQTYNVFDLVNILNWVDDIQQKYKKHIFVDFLINIHPEFLKVDILPEDMMKQAADSLIEYKNTKINKRSPELTVNSIDGIIGLLTNNGRSKDWKEQIDRLRSYTKILDKERNQNLELVNPKLAKLLND